MKGTTKATGVEGRREECGKQGKHGCRFQAHRQAQHRWPGRWPHKRKPCRSGREPEHQPHPTQSLRLQEAHAGNLRSPRHPGPQSPPGHERDDGKQGRRHSRHERHDNQQERRLSHRLGALNEHHPACDDHAQPRADPCQGQRGLPACPAAPEWNLRRDRDHQQCTPPDPPPQISIRHPRCHPGQQDHRSDARRAKPREAAGCGNAKQCGKNGPGCPEHDRQQPACQSQSGVRRLAARKGKSVETCRTNRCRGDQPSQACRQSQTRSAIAASLQDPEGQGKCPCRKRTGSGDGRHATQGLRLIQGSRQHDDQTDVVANDRAPPGYRSIRRRRPEGRNPQLQTGPGHGVACHAQKHGMRDGPESSSTTHLPLDGQDERAGNPCNRCVQRQERQPRIEPSGVNPDHARPQESPRTRLHRACAPDM